MSPLFWVLGGMYREGEEGGGVIKREVYIRWQGVREGGLSGLDWGREREKERKRGKRKKKRGDLH